MKTHLILIGILGWVTGSDLGAATVEAVKGVATAKAAQSLPPGSTFATKKSSQSQIRLDKGFVRLGSNSQLQLGKDDQVNLKEGVMMVGSDGAKRRGSVKVTAPGYSFQVQGTALIAYQPGSYIKITVLEGRIRVALQSLLGEFETIEAGQMLVINPADNRLPDPVEVDLNRLVTTSVLTAGALGPAPTDPFIQASAGEQSGDVTSGFVTRTPFALRGASPEVTVFQLVNDLDNPTAVVTEKNWVPPNPDQATTLSNVTFKRQGAKTGTLNVNLLSGGDNDEIPPSLNGNITVDPDVFGDKSAKRLVFTALTDPLVVSPGANIKTPAGTALKLDGLSLQIDGATLRAGNAAQVSERIELVAVGTNPSREFDADIKGSTLEAGQVHVQGSNLGGPQRVGFDSTQVTAPQGINVGINTAPGSITIRNSSELAALAGSIKFDSSGRPILVDASTLRANATSGGIVLDAGEAGADATVTLRNANLNADVIKARGHSANGDAVIIDGGSFVARTVLKFYAAGASMLRFRGNVSIDSPRSIFSARTVQVDLGGSVTSTGIVDIFVNPGQDHFNKPGFGTITTQTRDFPAGVAPNVLPFDSPTRPAF